jgi:hypothetical protein
MPYRVYEAAEFDALAAPATDTGSEEPRANRYQDALNRLEEEGYRLVAVDPGGDDAARLLVFHRPDPDLETGGEGDGGEPHRRISNIR